HLIRHPARVIASYGAKRAAPSLEDIGFPQQLALIERLGGVVIDSFDIRKDPAKALGKLCQASGIPFDKAMLRWPAGPKPFDGVWAPYWYDAVHRSTGFAGPHGPLPDLTGDAQALCDAALPYYRAMADRAIT
ncbi:MAG: HAD family hydrolase, partial [Pseudomonadota bacterium]